MQSKIKMVKRELRGLKKSSHAVKRLIETQGIHFKRIKALEELPRSERVQALIEAAKGLIASLGIEEEIEKSAETQRRYNAALSSLSLTDKAMVLDCYIGGLPYWKIGMEYGFAEEGARKHLDALVKKIAENI